MNNLIRAVTHLAASPHEMGWQYYDHAMQVWYVATERELELLGAMLAEGQPDAYSTWCSEVAGVPA
jgi:hypothetical protein